MSDSSTGIVDTMIQQLEHENYQIIVVGLGNPRKSLVNRLSSASTLTVLPKSTSNLLTETMPEILEVLCGK